MSKFPRPTAIEARDAFALARALLHHGAILADIKRDYVRAHLLKFADGAAMVRRLAGLFRELESEASRWIKTEGNTVGRIGFTALPRPALPGTGIRPAGLHLRLAAPQAQRGGDWRVVPSRAREGLRFPRTRNTDRDHDRAPPGHGQDPPDPPAHGPIRRSSAPARESPDGTAGDISWRRSTTAATSDSKIA